MGQIYVVAVQMRTSKTKFIGRLFIYGTGDNVKYYY